MALLKMCIIKKVWLAVLETVTKCSKSANEPDTL